MLLLVSVADKHEHHKTHYTKVEDKKLAVIMSTYQLPAAAATEIEAATAAIESHHRSGLIHRK